MKSCRLSLVAGALLVLATTGSANAQESDLLMPANAKPGECYARVFVPPKSEIFTEQVLVRPASEESSVTKPRYEWVEKTVMVEEPGEKLEIVPARYETVEEKVLVKEAAERLVVTPAEYETVEERVLVRPAYTTWKKGRGLIEKIDEETGEILCRVEIPAEYKTVSKVVMKTPERIEKVVIPAEYKMVKKRVMVEPPKTVKTTIPARYSKVRVLKLVEPAKQELAAVPAKYATVTKSKQVSEGRLEWRSVLCETNTGKGTVEKIQRALQAKGYNPGRIDGVIGDDTMAAVTRFQEQNGLPSGKLTMETIRALGVSI